MSISETRSAKKYASIAETAAAQAKLYADKLESAPDYAEQAEQSAISAAQSASDAASVIPVVNNLANSASQSATEAAASAAEAGNAAAAAIGRSLRVPSGESLSEFPASISRENTVAVFGPAGDADVKSLNEFAVLDGDGKIPVSMIPSIALTEPFVVSSQAQMLALDAQVGDIAKRTDLGYSFCLASSPPSTLSNWVQLTDDVLAQLGQQTGAASIGAVDDGGSPTTVQLLLNTKANKSTLLSQTGATTVGAVDDSSNPVTVQQALNLKASLASLLSNTGATKIGTQSGATAQAYFTATDVNTVQDLIASSIPSQIKEVIIDGYYDTGGKRDIWIRSTETASPSQTPLQLNKLAVSDALGSVWYLDISSGNIYIDSIGAKGDGTTDDWYHLELCFKNAEQGSNRVVKGNARQYYFSKPILLKTGRHLEFTVPSGLNIYYGGDVLTESDAPSAQTPAGTGFTSVFAGKKAQVIVAHAASDFARLFSLKNCYITNKAGVATPDYGVYCPFGNQFSFDGVQFSAVMLGIDSRNLYTGSFRNVFFSAPNGVMGTVGVNITPISNGLGSGTSLVFENVGVLGFRYSYFVNEMNYSTWISCYTEGALTRRAGQFTRCNGISLISYGIENLTAVAGDGRLFSFIDSQADVIQLQASFNINLAGTSAITVTSTLTAGISQVNISGMYITAVGAAYTPVQTDDSSQVRVFGIKYAGTTPTASIYGKNTVVMGEQGSAFALKVGGQWDGGRLEVGTARLWDNAGQLRVKYGSNPTSATDGVAL